MKARITRPGLILSTALISTTVQAIDSGNIHRFEDSKELFHASVIVESERRTFNLESDDFKQMVAELIVPVPASGNDSPLNQKQRSELKSQMDIKGGITSYNVLFRANIFAGEQISLFADAGIYNDVDAVISPPLIAGGGARLSQEIFPDFNLSIFGKAHLTEIYHYQIYSDLKSAQISSNLESTSTRDVFLGDYLTHIKGRFLTGTMGAVMTYHIPLASVQAYPYVGGEASFVRSSGEIKDIEVPGASITLFDRLDGRTAITVFHRNIFYLIMGITLKRPNSATIRVETKISPGDRTLSLGLGLML